MFTGIIEEIGKVMSLIDKGTVYSLEVEAPQISPETRAGQSISVNGVCLTVVKAQKSRLVMEIMAETIKRTNLLDLKGGDSVNLERALASGGRIDGHFVSGHIDDTGEVSQINTQGVEAFIQLTAKKEVMHYIALKCSVALDGVSLTVSRVEAGSFRVDLIPYTLENTTLGTKRKSDKLNIECDILAKYIEKIISRQRPAAKPDISTSFLAEHGFI